MGFEYHHYRIQKELATIKWVGYIAWIGGSKQPFITTSEIPSLQQLYLQQNTCVC